MRLIHLIVLAVFQLCQSMPSGFDPAVDYYNLLGVPVSASKKDIRDSYRGLRSLHDPDRNPEASVTFFDGRLRKIVKNVELIDTYLRTIYLPLLRRAYAVLDDGKRRPTYDKWRKQKGIDEKLYDEATYLKNVAQEIEALRTRNMSVVRGQVHAKVREELINDTIQRKQLNITEVCREQCEAGTCTEAGVCKCTNPRKHTGKFCEEEIDPVCLPGNWEHTPDDSSCLNGGECVKDNFISRCACLPNFGGVNCEHRWKCFIKTDRTRPGADRCKHGKCLEIKQYRYFDGDSNRRARFQKCLCNFGYTGRICAERLESDTDWSCVNGDLITDPPHFACDCDPGWQGQNCKQPCERNFYGKGCVLGCLGIHFCKHAAPCDPVDGECPRVGGDDDPCDPGWTGAACDFPSQYYVVSYFEQSNTDIYSDNLKGQYYDYQREQRVLTRFMLQFLLSYDLEGYIVLRSRQLISRNNRRPVDKVSSGSAAQKIAKNTKPKRTVHRMRKHKNRQRRQAENVNLESLDSESLEEQARNVGFIVHKFKFTRKQPRTIGVRFNVNFPKDENVDLQEVVNDVLRSNAHKYNSSFGDNFKIDTKSISVSKAKEVVVPASSTSSGTNSPKSGLGLLMLGLTLIALLVIASGIFMWKSHRNTTVEYSTYLKRQRTAQPGIFRRQDLNQIQRQSTKRVFQQKVFQRDPHARAKKK